MKIILKFSALYLMLVLTMLVMLDISFVRQRNTEMKDSLSNSMRTVLKGSNINVMYEMDESDMQVELIRNFAENINTDSDYQVQVLSVDKEGLLDVKVISSYEHLNGTLDTDEFRKTMIVEEVSNE